MVERELGTRRGKQMRIRIDRVGGNRIRITFPAIQDIFSNSNHSKDNTGIPMGDIGYYLPETISRKS